MRRFLYFLCILFLLVGFEVGYAKVPEPLKSFDVAAQLSKIEGKDLIVMFSSNSCYYCRKFISVTYTDPAVQRLLSNNYIFSELLLEDKKHKMHFMGKELTYLDFARAFEIRGTPTFVFFDAAIKPITGYPGYAPPQVFVKVLRYISQRLFKKVKFDVYYKRQDSFWGKQSVREITKQQASFVLRNDPYAVLLKPEDNIEGLDRSRRYVVCSGQFSGDIVSKMKEMGFFTILEVKGCKSGLGD